MGINPLRIYEQIGIGFGLVLNRQTYVEARVPLEFLANSLSL